MELKIFEAPHFNAFAVPKTIISDGAGLGPRKLIMLPPENHHKNIMIENTAIVYFNALNLVFIKIYSRK
mgnify:CR=1 FL=1